MQPAARRWKCVVCRQSNRFVFRLIRSNAKRIERISKSQADRLDHGLLASPTAEESRRKLCRVGSLYRGQFSWMKVAGRDRKRKIDVADLLDIDADFTLASDGDQSQIAGCARLNRKLELTNCGLPF